MGRTAAGVRGMNTDGSEVIGACKNADGENILVVSKYGYGKKSKLEDYRLTSRGAKGVKTLNINERNGELVALKAVQGDEDCMIMASDGIIIRIHLDSVSTLGRATQGIRLIKPQEGAFVSAVTILDQQEEESGEEHDQETAA